MVTENQSKLVQKRFMQGMTMQAALQIYEHEKWVKYDKDDGDTFPDPENSAEHYESVEVLMSTGIIMYYDIMTQTWFDQFGEAQSLNEKEVYWQSLPEFYSNSK